MDAQPARSHAEDVKRDIQATLEARRELGPAYDEQFLDALVERMTREVAQARQARLPADNRFMAQRSELAIVASLVFAIPLIAIAGARRISRVSSPSARRSWRLSGAQWIRHSPRLKPGDSQFTTVANATAP